MIQFDSYFSNGLFIFSPRFGGLHFPFQVAAHNFAIGADDAAAYAEVAADEPNWETE